MKQRLILFFSGPILILMMVGFKTAIHSPKSDCEELEKQIQQQDSVIISLKDKIDLLNSKVETYKKCCFSRSVK